MRYRLARSEWPIVTRHLAAAACAMWVCISGCLSCPVLNAQERGIEEPAAFSSGSNVRRVFFEVRLAEEQSVRGLTSEGTVKTSGRKIHLHNTTVVANSDVVKATVLEVGGRYDVAIQLSPQGAARMTTATSRHVGRPLAIILDGDIVAVSTVTKALAGEVVCSGGFTRSEAMKIAAGLEKW